MNEADSIEVYYDDFAQDVGDFALYTGRSFEEELLFQGKQILRKIVKLTPPFTFNDSIAKAKKQGEKAIARDLRRVFKPVDLVGSRKIPHLFGRTDVEGLPYVVPTRETHPDVERIYEQSRTLKKIGGKNWLMRSRRAKYYVDRRKFDKLVKKIQKQVGFLGAGFGSAAQKLGVALPGFMGRHKGKAPGSIQINFTDTDLELVIINSVNYANQIKDFRRRIDWAVRAQSKAMERQLPYLIKRHEKLVN